MEMAFVTADQPPLISLLDSRLYPPANRDHLNCTSAPLRLMLNVGLELSKT
jgi:hypothetical protein